MGSARRRRVWQHDDVQADPRRREEQRDDEALTEDGGLADRLATAMAAGDAGGVLDVLETLVVRRAGGRPEDGTPIEALEPASSAAGYRDVAPVPVARALGDDATGRMLAHLLRRADAMGRTREVVASLGPYLREHTSVVHVVAADLAEHAPRLVALLGDLAPGLVRVGEDDLSALLGAPPTELSRALPRLAHWPLPALNRKRRNRLAPLIHAVAALDHPDAPAAIRALARIGVPIDRRIDGKLPVERAAEAGALENLRALEGLGARPRPAPARSKPPEPSSSKVRTRSRGLGSQVRASSSSPESSLGKPWWEAPVRPKHIAMLLGVVGALASSIALGHVGVGLTGFGVLIAIGLLGWHVKLRAYASPRRRRGRWEEG